MRNIEYIGEDKQDCKKGKIHAKKGNTTGCGIRIDDNPKDWRATHQAVTCEKNGCKGKL